MEKLLIFFIAIILSSGCGTFDPEGIWQSELEASQKYLILKVANDIVIRKPQSRNWAGFKNIAANKYRNETNLEVIQFQSPDKMEVFDKNGMKLSAFTRIVLEEADPKVISPQMTKAQVLKFIGHPQEKFTEDLTEKWLYKNNLLLIFDAQGVSKMNTNYKKDRDFAKIQLGMTRQQVSDIIGNPDVEGIRKESGGGYQKWFYGKNTAIVFDNQEVINIDLNSKQEEERKDSSSPTEQVFTLMDITNDKPAGFVIEDQFTEFLNCDCLISEEGPRIKLEGEKSSVSILLGENKKFTATNSYNILNTEDRMTTRTDKVDLMLSSLRFEKDKKLIGFIRLEKNCYLEMDRETAPCYFKGTFECTFK